MIDWIEPDLGALESGSIVDLMVRPLCDEPTGYQVARTVLKRQHVWIDQTLPLQGMSTLFQVQIQHEAGLVCVKRGPTSSVLLHTHDFRANFQQTIEACAGIGAVTQGFAACGVDVAVHVEQAEPYAAILRSGGKQVIHGDIADSATLQKLASAKVGFLTAGVSCQPFSALGDGRQQYDDRSKSFPAVLKAMLYLGIPVLVLECTKQALDSTWVQKALADYAQRLGFTIRQRLLDIKEFWPAKRQRWWCVVGHGALGIRDIPDFPAFPFQPSIVHVTPRMLQLEGRALQELKLDLHELRQFSTRPDMSKHIMDPCKPLPTATHSWGCQVTACACGCRQYGLSEARLDAKGLYGQLVPLPTQSRNGSMVFQDARHMHAVEVALFNGLQPDSVPNADGQRRLALTGVGQMASPLQGAWVMSHVLQDVHRNLFPLPNYQDPMVVLKNMIGELLRQRNQWFSHAVPTRWTQLFEQAIEQWGVQVIPPTISTDDLPIVPVNDHDQDTNRLPFSSAPVETSPEHSGGGSQVLHPVPMEVDPTSGGIFPTGAQPAQASVETMSSLSDELDQSIQHFFDGHDETLPSASHDDMEDLLETTGERLVDPIINQVYVVFPGQGIHTVLFQDASTVGNLSVASACLGQTHEINRVSTVMGTLLLPTDVLTPGQFINVGPVEQDPCQCPLNGDATMPVLSGHTREQLLWDQKGWVAYDEMQTYLRAIRNTYHDTIMGILLLEDLPDYHALFCKSIVQAVEALKQADDDSVRAWVILNQGHWFPVAVQKSGQQHVLHTTQDSVGYVTDMMLQVFGSHDFVLTTHDMPHVFPADCGFQTVGWLISLITGTDMRVPFTEAQAARWRALFHHELVKQGKQHEVVTEPLLLGGATCKEQLVALIQEHGVHPNRASDCADQLLQTIGASSIQATLRSPRPWADLKAKASARSPPLRIVLAEELKEAIQSRVKQPRSFGSKANKKPKGIEQPLVLKADQLGIPTGLFRVEGGGDLQQVPAASLGPRSNGVCVANFDEVEHFLRVGKSLSTEGSNSKLATMAAQAPYALVPGRDLDDNVEMPFILGGWRSAVEVLLANRAYVVKKIGCIPGEEATSSSSKPTQVTWSKYNGAAHAWLIAKQWAKFV
eukprot:Skav236364  [mRNA]  locus=scaffold1770:8680:18124:+ [translate_table: standard]